MDGILTPLIGACILIILISMTKAYLEGKSPFEIFLHVPLLLLIGYISYVAWRDSEEIAKVRSRLEKAREREKDLKLKLAMAAVDEKKEELQKELDELETANKKLETEIERLKVDYEKDRVAVDDIHTWDDFWKHMGKGSQDEDPPDASPDN